MKLWHISVGCGRFIVRAEDEEKALELARKEAEQYSESREHVLGQKTNVDELSPVGDPAVIDTDYS